MSAEIRLIDDNDDYKVLDVTPDTVVDVKDHFIPCNGCGKVVLMDIPGNSIEGCHTCKEEEMKHWLKWDKEELAGWLNSWGWDYEHPGYWKHTKPYGCIMVGEYIGFYMGDPGTDGNEAFMTVTYEDYEGRISLLKAMNLINDDDEGHIRMAIRHDTYTEPKTWDMDCGGLQYPDGIVIYNVKEPNRRIEIPGNLLTSRPVEDWDADDHAYLASLAEVIVKWLDNNLS